MTETTINEYGDRIHIPRYHTDWHPGAIVTDLAYGMHIQTPKDTTSTSLIIKKKSDVGEPRQMMRFILVDEDLKDLIKEFETILEEHKQQLIELVGENHD